MKIFIFCFTLVLAVNTPAEEKKKEASGRELTDFERTLMADANIRTKETIVEADGRKYRKVEYEGKTYYFQLFNQETPNDQLQLKCERDGHIEDKAKILVARKITSRTKLFIEGLKAVCAGDSQGRKELRLDADIKIGFMLSDDPNDLIKNKKIFISPFGSAGFYGEW